MNCQVFLIFGSRRSSWGNMVARASDGLARSEEQWAKSGETTGEMRGVRAQRGASEARSTLQDDGRWERASGGEAAGEWQFGSATLGGPSFSKFLASTNLDGENMQAGQV